MTKSASTDFDRLCSTFAQYYPWQKLLSLDLLFLVTYGALRVLKVFQESCQS